MPRMWAMKRPTLRIRIGRSFGPTTISATTPTIRKSRIRPSGNMRRQRSAGDGVFFRLRMRQRLARGRRRGGVVPSLETVTEGADPFGGVTHDTGNLSPATEHDHQKQAQDQQVPWT